MDETLFTKSSMFKEYIYTRNCLLEQYSKTYKEPLLEGNLTILCFFYYKQNPSKAPNQLIIHSDLAQ